MPFEHAAGLLGLAACASLSAAACCAVQAVGPAPTHHEHGGHRPEKAPDQPAACHAVLGCAAHRKLRAFP